MPRLIDADVAERWMKQNEATIDIAILKAIPTIDAVPVIRCKDCRYGDWDNKANDAMVCIRTNDGYWRSGDDFCSFGERKDDIK